MVQQIIDYLYRYPKSKLQYIKRFGGYINYQKIFWNQKQMQKLSGNLAIVQSVKNGLPIYFLTGKKYLYQTLFCIQSLVKVTNEKFEFNLVDDGTFDDNLIKIIQIQIPGANIITKTIIDQNLLEKIPLELFPILNHKRLVYPHIKKLTDIHTLPGNKWKLVLDSDMLFWATPRELIKWLHNPDKPIFMTDCVESYGYSVTLMENLCGRQLQPLINVGAIGLESESINWQNLENWIRELEDKEGKKYYLEQALSAMIIGDKESTRLDSHKYIVNPNKDIVDKKKGALHHYVDLSKEWYFKVAWKEIL